MTLSIREDSHDSNIKNTFFYSLRRVMTNGSLNVLQRDLSIQFKGKRNIIRLGPQWEKWKSTLLTIKKKKKTRHVVEFQSIQNLASSVFLGSCQASGPQVLLSPIRTMCCSPNRLSFTFSNLGHKVSTSWTDLASSFCNKILWYELLWWRSDFDELLRRMNLRSLQF